MEERCNCPKCKEDNYEYIFVKFLNETEKEQISDVNKRQQEAIKKLERVKQEEQEILTELVLLRFRERSLWDKITNGVKSDLGFKVDGENNILYELIKK